MTEKVTGVGILGAILRNDNDLAQIVPGTQIKAGRLPDNISLPALLLRTVSSVERHTLKRRGTKRMIDRVSVTVRAPNYRQQQDIIALIQSIAGGRTGDIGGGERVAIRTAGTGPDLYGPGDSYEQGQDFRVTFETQS